MLLKIAAVIEPYSKANCIMFACSENVRMATYGRLLSYENLHQVYPSTVALTLVREINSNIARDIFHFLSFDPHEHRDLSGFRVPGLMGAP